MKALLETARVLGADHAGIASIDDLGRLGFTWPEGARSVVVVALAHPPGRPEMDWWFGRSDPPGNRLLAGIVQGLCEWVSTHLGCRATHLPYHVERGGTYLKDVAVHAGLGCIGLNNLLVTPDFGPRVRLRALLVDASLPSTGPIAFDPCQGCDAPCRVACPQGVFGQTPGAAAPLGAAPVGADLAGVSPSLARPRLPARTGEFSRAACYAQMDLDVDAALPAGESSERVIRYCRACELSCRVGA